MAILFGTFSVLHLCFLFLISLFLFRLFFGGSRQQKNLPPGPPPLPILGNLLQLGFSKDKFEGRLNRLHEKYGPIITLWMGSSRLLVMVADRQVAYEALIQKGSVFADRPRVRETLKLFSNNQHSINTAAYGQLWRILRRNLINEALSPSAMKAFGEGREWGIGGLLANLRDEAARNAGAVRVVEKLRTAVFSILFYMCFGTNPDEATASNVLSVIRDVILSGMGLEELFAIPGFLLRRRRARMAEIRRREREALLPFIHNRRDASPQAGGAYVDSLLALTVEDGRSLDDDDLVTLCSEFMIAGIDTTSTVLQWAMANLVIRQDVQARLYDEIIGVTGGGRPVGEEDVPRMPFLEAVVKETLRRHPPGHFLLPHTATRPSDLAGFNVPVDASVYFYIADMGMDPGVWQNPAEFRPERYVDDGVEVDLTGTKDIKMIPFGVGRRMCPGIGLALLHIQLIVARLVQEFAWKCKPGETVDLSETSELTMVMKYPLHAIIKERREPMMGTT